MKTGSTHDEAKRLCKVRCEAFGKVFNWDTLPEKKKEGYRAMIRLGVCVRNASTASILTDEEREALAENY